MKHLFAITVVAAILVGCQSYPMGLNEAQWHALSPEQQADYTRQQAQIDEQRRAEREAEAQRRRAEEAERARLEQERVRLAYAIARPGTSSP